MGKPPVTSTKRAYGTGRIYKPAGCQFWYVQYWQRGKQIRESSRSTTKAVAEALLRERLVGRDNGKLPYQEQKKLTYADLREMLLNDYRTKEKSLQTLADGEETIWGLQPLDKFFGYPENPGPQAIAITNATAAKFIRERREEGISNGTIRLSLLLLTRMFNLAKAEGKIAQVPIFTKPPKPEPKKDFIREPQFDVLLQTMPAELRPYLIFLFYQRTRSKEAAAILWNQIDLKRALYAPDAAINKTKDDRLRVLHDRVVAALAGVDTLDNNWTKKVAGALERFSTPHGETKVFDTTNVRKTFMKACLKLGLARYAWVCGQCLYEDGTGKTRPHCPKCAAAPLMLWRYAGQTIHGLRRSCVKYYQELGAAEATIMKITGYKTRSVFDDYSPADVESQRRVMTLAAEAPKAQLLPSA